MANPEESQRPIINTWDQCRAAGGDRIYLSYQSNCGVVCAVAGWHVGRMINGVKTITDKGASWDDYGCKFFISAFNGGKNWRECKKIALADAIAWANQTFGTREFVRNSMGDYVEKEVNEKFPLRKRER